MDVIKQDAVGGVVTFWTLGEFSERHAVLQGWGAADLAPFVPEPQDPVTVLKDALTKAVAGRDTLIRPLAKRSGFEVVKEVRGNERNGYEHLARAEVTAGGAPLVVSGSPNWTGQDSDRVYAQFAAYSGQVPAGRLASALVRMLSSFGAVRLRPTGGIYYLPGAKLARWQEAVAVVEGAGKNAVYLMQQSLTPETVRAVRDALTAEIETTVARLEEEILSGDLGEKALATRVSEAAALRVKAEAYESILGVGLESLKGLADKVGQTHLMGTLLGAPQ